MLSTSCATQSPIVQAHTVIELIPNMRRPESGISRTHELHAASGVTSKSVSKLRNVAFFDLGSRMVASYWNVPRRVGDSILLMNDAKSEEDLWWVLTNKVTWPPEIEHRRIFPAPISCCCCCSRGPTCLTASGSSVRCMAACAVLYLTEPVCAVCAE